MSPLLESLRTRMRQPVSASVVLNIILILALLSTVGFTFLFLRPTPPEPVKRVVVMTKFALNKPPTHWLDLYGPDSSPLNAPMGVDAAPDGRIYVADTGNAQVQVFRIERGATKWLARFGQIGEGPGRFIYPTDVLVRHGKVYVADLKGSRIQIFDLDGAFIGAIPDPRRHPGLELGPAALGDDAKGNMYVSTLNHEVLIFDAQDRLVGKVGAAGQGDGELSYPWGVARNIDGRLWIGDTNNGRVQTFDPENRYLYQMGNLAMPRGVATDSHGRIYIVDVLQHMVFVISKNSDNLFSIGQRGLDEGEFNFPNDISIRNDVLYVADRENNRISLWTY